MHLKKKWWIIIINALNKFIISLKVFRYTEYSEA